MLPLTQPCQKPFTFLHTAAPIDLRSSSLHKTLLKISPATGVDQGTLRFLTLTHAAYGACPNCSRLRAGRLENPPKSLAERLAWPHGVCWRGFSARCCDCAGWWCYWEEKLLSLPPLKVVKMKHRNKEKWISKVNGANRILWWEIKVGDGSGWWVRGSHEGRQWRAIKERERERQTAREREKETEREVGDWSYERVVMVTSDHDEVEDDQRRLLERKCKYIQIHDYIRHEAPMQDSVTSEFASVWWKPVQKFIFTVKF